MINKIRKIFKKLVLCFVSVIILMNNLSINTFAITYTTGRIIHSDWWLADPSTGRRDDGSHEAELLVNGEQVFCIDALTRFKNNVEMQSVSWSTVGISEEKAKELSLIAYFGTKVSGRTGKNWYAVTQGLIWKTIHSDEPDICYVETPLNPNYATTKQLWKEIMADVENYKKKPSFINGTYSVDFNDSIVLTDTNNILKDMVISNNGGLDVSIDGNKLTIHGSASAKDETTIVLKKNIKVDETGTSLVFYNGKDQSLAKFKIRDPMQVALKVKVNKFGKLELVKYNADKSAVVEDTSYRITGPNKYDKTFTTDSNGKIRVDRLMLGEYKAVETKAGNGYLINVTEKTFTIKANETTKIDFSNGEPTGKIELTKTIDTSKTNGLKGDAVLKGNTYGLYAKDKITNKAGTKTFYQKDDLVSSKKTDGNGKIIWDNLPLGDYYIKEKESNNTLVLNNSVINVLLEYEGQTVSKVTSSKKTSNKVNMQKIQIFKSGEKEGMSGFVKGLQGAEFTWKLKSEVNHVGWNNATTYAVITTDANGIANTPYLPYGEYLVKETKTPLDYITAPDFTVSVTDDYSEYKDVEQVKCININNRPFTSQVRLIKVDMDSGKTVTLNSASFKIKDSQGNYVIQKVGGVKIDTFTTNSKNQIITLFGTNGEVTLPLELGAGTYFVEEIRTPEGFLELEEAVSFTITNVRDYDVDEDEAPILTVKVKNAQPHGKLVIKKTDKVTSDPLENVEYELTAKENIINAIDGSVIYKKGTVVSTGKTNAQGILTINDLPMGNYSLKETLTNDGYVLSEEIKDIIFEQKDITTKECVINVNITNIKPHGEIRLEKTDCDTKELLSGVTFQLTAKEDIYSMDGRNTLIYKEGDTVSKDISKDGYYMTNELGEINISNLPLGKYLLKEITPLEGYYTDKNEYEINLSYDHSDKVIYTQTLNVTNMKSIVEISKVDATDSKELEGAHLSLYDKDDNLIEEWISINEPHIIRGLKINEEYRLHEDLAPLGYDIASDITFIVTDDTVTKVTMKDECKPVIVKTGDDTDIYTLLVSLGASLLLAGALITRMRRKRNGKK